MPTTLFDPPPVTRTFGSRCASALKEAKRLDPTLPWSEVARIIDTQYILAGRDAGTSRATKSERKELFEALCAILRLVPSEVPRAGAQDIAVAIADIRAVTPGLTADELQRRARAYRTKHPTWHLTASALAKHWGEFGSGERTLASRRDIYIEPPAIWREVAKKMYPDATNWITPYDFTTIPWQEVSHTIRPDILRAMP